ncbi:MAG: hemolysin III family protein [Spirochaetales bacterium]|nr:hemolysin III family protein [Spirochaetales bacterium]
MNGINLEYSQEKTASKNIRFTRGEEIANAVSHGAGAVFAVVALVLLVVSSIKHGTVWHTVTYSIYGATLLILYLSSTFNHSLPLGTAAKDFFHNFDQIAIFLLIAGTYTPLSIAGNGIRHDWGWVIFGIEWGAALAGIIIKIFIPNKFEKGVNTAYIIMYAIMGWLLLFFIVPIFKHINLFPIIMILVGGACYTLGVIFFKLEGKLKYCHLGWHLMVLAGSICHWVAIWTLI